MVTKRSLIFLDKVIECVFERNTRTDIIKPSELGGYMFYELFVSKEEDRLWIAGDNKGCYDIDYYIRDRESKERKILKEDLFKNIM